MTSFQCQVANCLSRDNGDNGDNGLLGLMGDKFIIDRSLIGARLLSLGTSKAIQKYEASVEHCSFDAPS